MNISQGLKLLDKEPTSFRCTSCASVANSYNQNFGICQFCEMYCDKSDAILKKVGVLELLEGIWKSSLNSKFDDALKSYNSLYDATKLNSVLYAKGVFCTFVADIELSKRDYVTPNGFMEQNSLLAKSALARYSMAKELFFKTISLCDKELASSPNPNAIYLKLLCNLKLGKTSEAKRQLDLLNSNAKDLPITLYANMLYAHASNQKHPEAHYDKVLELGIPNAFYYYSDYFASKGNHNEAKFIIKKLQKRIWMPLAQKLLLGIERVQGAL